MYNFNVEKNKTPFSWKISCIKSRCQETSCPDLDFNEIKNDLNLECSVFSLYKKLGITVIKFF